MTSGYNRIKVSAVVTTTALVVYSDIYLIFLPKNYESKIIHYACKER